MHDYGKMIRCVISILGAAAVVGALLATVTSASAAPSRFTATTTTFTLKGSIAGGITTIQSGQTLTYVFTEVNQTTKGAYEDLGLVHTANVSLVDMTCVFRGAAFNADTPFCEPGLVKPGQRASMVATTTVTGASGAAASARVCLLNEKTGAKGPCKTLSVPIA